MWALHNNSGKSIYEKWKSCHHPFVRSWFWMRCLYSIKPTSCNFWQIRFYAKKKFSTDVSCVAIFLDLYSDSVKFFKNLFFCQHRLYKYFFISFIRKWWWACVTFLSFKSKKNLRFRNFSFDQIYLLKYILKAMKRDKNSLSSVTI